MSASLALRLGRTGRRQRVSAGLAATLLVVTMPFVQLLTGSRTAMYSDINEYHAPMAITAWRAVRQGHLPFWSGLVFGGQNVVGVGQAAVFYGPNALFGWLHPITAFRWWLLFHVWLAAAGAFAWSWHRWRSVPGAVVSGVAYGLNGFIVLHIAHMPLLAMAAWLPLAFLGLDLVIERWSLPRAALLAGSLAAISLTGHPQGLWQAGVGLGIVACVQLVRSGRGLGPWVRAAGGVGLGLGLGAVQALPLYLFSRTSVRPELSIAQAFTHSSEPRFLLTLAVPRGLGSGSAARWGSVYAEAANYLGITMIALAMVGVIHLGRDRRSVGLMSIAAFGLVTSLGGHTPLGRLVYDVVPLAGGFRAWARNLVLVDVAVACLAGSGVRAVLASPTRWRRPFSIGILGLAGALLILPALTDLGGAIAHGHDRAITFGGPIVLLLGVLGALALLPIQRQWGTTLLVLTCSLDMVAFTAAAPWTSDGGSPAQVTRYYSAEPASIGAPADEPGGVDRWVSQSGQPRGVALVKEYPSVNGYDPIIQASYARTVSDMAGSGELYRTDFLEPGWLADVLRVTTLIVDHEVVPTDPLWRRDRSLLGGLVRWVRTPRLAEAMLVGNVQFASLDEIRDRLRSSATDLTRTAYIESGPTADGAGRGAATDESPGVVIGSMGPTGSGRFDVDATSPALLVISSTWLDGWRATVDGTSVPVVRANGLVLGVAVPAGRHTVVVNFTPPGVRLGLLVSVLSLVGLVTPSVAMASRGRRRSPPLA